MNSAEKRNFALLFLVVIITFSIFSIKNLFRFYVYDEINYNEWTVDAGTKLETDFISNFINKMDFVNLNGAVRNILNQSEMNGVIKLNNGYLLTTLDYVSNEKLQEYTNRVALLNTYLENKHIPLIFAITPYTSNKYDPQLPIGINDWGNDNIDRFIELLKIKNINTMDFREIIHKDEINQYDIMYKTDHHWTTKAGFYAYIKLENTLKKLIDYKIDEQIKNIDNYTITTYENWHLGSRGQRTGIYFAGIDDFDLIVPNFETFLKNGEKQGTFEELIINKDPLNNREYTSRYTYDNVLGNSLSNYINPLSLNDKKILIVTDSMGKAVNPYLILSFHEIKTLSNYNSENLTKNLIDSYKPDIVILLYYPGRITNNSTGFNFQGFD